MTALILKNLRKEQKGFTLIELLAVIVILGVIAAIAIPLISKVITNAKSDSDTATAAQVYDAARLYVTGELQGDYTVPAVASGITIKAIQDAGYLSTSIVLPSTKTPIAAGTVLFNSSGVLTSVKLDSKTFTAKEILGDKSSPATSPATS